MTLTYLLEDLDHAAEQLLSEFTHHRIFCFEGELGAGKTTLIEKICEQLGSHDALSSPTFSIINEYNSPVGVLCHMDWYRLKNEEEAIHIGVEDYLFSKNYCFIEWHQRAESIIPRPYVLIKIQHDEPTKRTLTTKIVQ